MLRVDDSFARLIVSSPVGSWARKVDSQLVVRWFAVVGHVGGGEIENGETIRLCS